MTNGAALISVSCSPQLDTSRSCKTTDTGPVHRVVCPFTPQLSLVLINRPSRDGKSGTVSHGHRARRQVIRLFRIVKLPVVANLWQRPIM